VEYFRTQVCLDKKHANDSCFHRRIQAARAAFCLSQNNSTHNGVVFACIRGFFLISFFNSHLICASLIGGGEGILADMQAFSARIEGHVQGVGFRQNTKNQADQRALTGWVRNTADGAVEVWAEGGELALEQFRQWLASGPAWANVTRVHVQPERALGTYKRFAIRY
jgi:acylphosphatase